jgi:FixJ family two-component response regulator
MDPVTPLITIVDDDLPVRRALGRSIRAAGYAVETFASAREFLDASAQGRTSCLILDIHLDGMSGFELAAQLSADGAAIPIILITAHDDPLTRERARQADVAAYIAKPFDERDLLEAIRGTLGLMKTDLCDSDTEH